VIERVVWDREGILSFFFSSFFSQNALSLSSSLRLSFAYFRSEVACAVVYLWWGKSKLKWASLGKGKRSRCKVG